MAGLGCSFPQKVALTQTGKNVKSNACAQMHTKKEGGHLIAAYGKNPKQLQACRMTTGSEDVVIKLLPNI